MDTEQCVLAISKPRKQPSTSSPIKLVPRGFCLPRWTFLSFANTATCVRDVEVCTQVKSVMLFEIAHTLHTSPNNSWVATAMPFGPKHFGLIASSPTNLTGNVSTPLKGSTTLSNDHGKIHHAPSLTLPRHSLTDLPPGRIPPTPINIRNELQVMLSCIDKITRHYLVHGFTYDFHTGFQGVINNSHIYNLSSALAQPLDVQANIDWDVAADRVQCPFSVTLISHLVLSPNG